MSRRRATRQEPAQRPTRAAIYLRVSTEEQAREGFGLDVQRERCLAMATVKGWQVDGAHVFADEGISGTKDLTARPGLAALFAVVEERQVNGVILLALDRLGRKSGLILDLVERITTAGVELVSCKESLDTTTPAGRFVLNIFAGLAQLERDTLVERTTSGREHRGRLDGEKGGRLPYGYLRTPEGTIIADERAAEVVRLIFARRRHRQSYGAIATELDALHIPPPQGAQRWYPMTVKIIASQGPMYRGGARNDSPVCWPRLL